MDTLELIRQRFNANFEQALPIKLNMDRMSGLPKLFWKLGFRVGAEIGTSTGRYARVLCRTNPKMKLYCIDPWTAYGDYVEANNLTGQVMLDNCLIKAKERLANCNCEFIKAYSMDAVKNFTDNSLDFVYIDANHTFEFALNDIVEWSKKVKVGGIISGHDYWNSGDVHTRHLHIKNPTPLEKIKLCQVKDAVNAWTKTNQINPWFVTGLDDCSSFLWVKN